jgi:hypothetical protein
MTDETHPETQPDEATSEAPAPEAAESAPSAEASEATPAKTAEEEAAEAIAAIGRLGNQFERAVRAIRPLKLVVETQRVDRAAFFRNFKGQRIEKLTRPRMIKILETEIFKRKSSMMAHLFMVLWNDAMRDLYIAIRDHVRTINEDVEAIEVIDDDKAQEFLDDLLSRDFELEDIFICVRLNEVRFTEDFVQSKVTPPSFTPVDRGV